MSTQDLLPSVHQYLRGTLVRKITGSFQRPHKHARQRKLKTCELLGCLNGRRCLRLSCNHTGPGAHLGASMKVSILSVKEPRPQQLDLEATLERRANLSNLSVPLAWCFSSVAGTMTSACCRFSVVVSHVLYPGSAGLKAPLLQWSQNNGLARSSLKRLYMKRAREGRVGGAMS